MKDSIKKWMKEWVDRASQVKSDECIEIEGIGKFEGLEIVPEQHDESNEITISFKYEEWDKNVCS